MDLLFLHRADTLNLATDPMFLMVRYRLGDLGLVPRPTWEHKPSSSGGGGARPSGAQLPPNRFVRTRELQGAVLSQISFFQCKKCVFTPPPDLLSQEFNVVLTHKACSQY